jgi:hypothetical protein
MENSKTGYIFKFKDFDDLSHQLNNALDLWRQDWKSVKITHLEVSGFSALYILSFSGIKE